MHFVIFDLSVTYSSSTLQCLKKQGVTVCRSRVVLACVLLGVAWCNRSSNHLHASPVNVLNSLRNVIRHSQHEPFYIGSCDSVERRTVSEKDMRKCESCLNFFQYSNNVKESNQIYVF